MSTPSFAALAPAAPSGWVWAGLFSVVGVLLTLDLGILSRRASAGVATFRAGVAGAVAWTAAAVGFGGWIWHWQGAEPAQQYLAGYLVELSLSVDNLFIFILVFDRLRIEPRHQHRVLFWGILGAIVLRTGFILAGIGLINRFEWVLYLFGAFLVFTGFRLAFHGEGATYDPKASPPIRFFTRWFPIRWESHQPRFFVIEDGRRWPTPLFAALVAVETADLVFALDSIPAVLGVTREAFLATASNIFAILGLRALYFVVSGALRRFRFLRAGLAALLVFVGVKMLANPWIHLSPSVSLEVIAGVLVAAVTASTLFPPSPRRPGGGPA